MQTSLPRRPLLRLSAIPAEISLEDVSYPVGSDAGDGSGLLSGRLLLGGAVDGPQSPDEIAAVDAYHLMFRQRLRDDV